MHFDPRNITWSGTVAWVRLESGETAWNPESDSSPFVGPNVVMYSRVTGGYTALLNPERSVMCGWCHTMVPCPFGFAVYCRNCGHRADVARLVCTCEKCCG